MNVQPFVYKERRQQAPLFKADVPRDPHEELAEENPWAAQALEVLHATDDVWRDYLKDGAAGTAGYVASGVVAVGSLGWGIARLRSSAWADKVDGVGNLALSALSTMETVGHFTGNEIMPWSHGPLDALHGVATAVVGLSDLLRARQEGPGERYAVGAFGMAFGVAITASALMPNLGPAFRLVALGALAGKEAALNWHSITGKPPAARKSG